eukprot:7896608-Karenia_brevis.AAC.1
MHVIQIINAWEGEVGRQWIKSRWDLKHALHPWARVKGPMGASQMHLMELGWEMQRYQGQLRLKDHLGD